MGWEVVKAGPPYLLYAQVLEFVERGVCVFARARVCRHLSMKT
jgi:hypothetical protein